MIVVVSTSSPFASVAVLAEDGSILQSGQEESRQNAGSVCLELIESFGVDLKQVRGFVADIGPGSFTGVRVGVMLAKTLGWAGGVPVAGVTSFDLIDSRGVVSLPALKGEWLCRTPGEEPKLTTQFEGKGYGTGAPSSDYPHAARVSDLIAGLKWVPAVELLPEYLLNPSISTPKKPYLPGAVN